MTGPVSTAIAAELVVVIAIMIGAAVITNMGTISSAIENLGWF